MERLNESLNLLLPSSKKRGTRRKFSGLVGTSKGTGKPRKHKLESIFFGNRNMGKALEHNIHAMEHGQTGGGYRLPGRVGVMAAGAQIFALTSYVLEYALDQA
jgi:hypothetical protein